MNENLDTADWVKCSHCKKKIIPVQEVSDIALKKLRNSGKFCPSACFLDELLGPIFFPTRRGGS